MRVLVTLEMRYGGRCGTKFQFLQTKKATEIMKRTNTHEQMHAKSYLFVLSVHGLNYRLGRTYPQLRDELRVLGQVIHDPEEGTEG